MRKINKYVLAAYEVIEDINLGGFFKFDLNNSFHNLAGLVLNTFLIAPSRSKWNHDLFTFLDSYYGALSLDDFTDINELKTSKALTLPLKFGVLNQRQLFYNLTNQICDILSQLTSEGIRYSSCYLPMGTIGIECNCYNIVLYQNGISKVRFLNHEVKENKNNFTEIDFIKMLLSKEK